MGMLLFTVETYRPRDVPATIRGDPATTSIAKSSSSEREMLLLVSGETSGIPEEGTSLGNKSVISISADMSNNVDSSTDHNATVDINMSIITPGDDAHKGNVKSPMNAGDAYDSANEASAIIPQFNPFKALLFLRYPFVWVTSISTGMSFAIMFTLETITPVLYQNTYGLNSMEVCLHWVAVCVHE